MGNVAVIFRSIHYLTPTSLLTKLYSSFFRAKSRSTPDRIAPTGGGGECNGTHVVGGDDVKVVMKRLGLAWDDDAGEDCCIVDSAHRIAEEEEASEDVLEQAFAVFDDDGDGYVTAEELRGLMCRLGLGEGMRLEDCRKMIEAFDDDGDGRIDLPEFRKLLERVVV